MTLLHPNHFPHMHQNYTGQSLTAIETSNSCDNTRTMKGFHTQLPFGWFLVPFQRQFIKFLGTNEQRVSTPTVSNQPDWDRRITAIHSNLAFNLNQFGQFGQATNNWPCKNTQNPTIVRYTEKLE